MAIDDDGAMISSVSINLPCVLHVFEFFASWMNDVDDEGENNLIMLIKIMVMLVVMVMTHRRMVFGKTATSFTRSRLKIKYA